LLTRLWLSTSEKGSPRHAWYNRKFDELVTEAVREIDEQKRTDLYRQAERILVEDVGGLFLSQTVT
jgi:ABC-type transport system substrate-binding protein